MSPQRHHLHRDQPDDAPRSLSMLAVINIFGLLSAEILAFLVARHLPWLRADPPAPTARAQ